MTADGKRTIFLRQMQLVEIDARGNLRDGIKK